METDRQSPEFNSGHGWAADPPSAWMDTSWTAETASDITTAAALVEVAVMEVTVVVVVVDLGASNLMPTLLSIYSINIWISPLINVYLLFISSANVNGHWYISLWWHAYNICVCVWFHVFYYNIIQIINTCLMYFMFVLGI